MKQSTHKKMAKMEKKCEKKNNGEKRNMHIHTLKSLPTQRQTSVAKETGIAGVKERAAMQLGHT